MQSSIKMSFLFSFHHFQGFPDSVPSVGGYVTWPASNVSLPFSSLVHPSSFNEYNLGTTTQLSSQSAVSFMSNPSSRAEWSSIFIMYSPLETATPLFTLVLSPKFELNSP